MKRPGRPPDLKRRWIEVVETITGSPRPGDRRHNQDPPATLSADPTLPRRRAGRGLGHEGTRRFRVHAPEGGVIRNGSSGSDQDHFGSTVTLKDWQTYALDRTTLRRANPRRLQRLTYVGLAQAFQSVAGSDPSEEREEPMSKDSASEDEQPEVDDGTLSEVLRRPTRTAGDLSEVADASPGITTEDLARDLETVASRPRGRTERELPRGRTERELLEDLLRRVRRIEEYLGLDEY
jgi:hypothetical protein